MYLRPMEGTLHIHDLLDAPEAWRIVDVRSPSEFLAGHIPGAINLPLFSDEERARVGTLYKQVSTEAAMQEGLGIAGVKMNDLLEAATRIARHSEKKLVVHCWRGGKRSEAVHWLLRFSGMEVFRLRGGYKSFRTELHNFFAKNHFRFNIIGGFTGTGKTELLLALQRAGQQIINLESLACHKGSAFGAIGEPPQPTTEQFENDLFMAFNTLTPARVVWLENESKNIGRNYLPEGLWRKMRNSLLFHIEVNYYVRLDRIVGAYANPPDVDILKDSFSRIQKRLGGLEYKMAIEALDKGDLRKAAAIALNYYDKSYTFQLAQWPADRVVRVADCDDLACSAQKLIDLDVQQGG